MNDIQIGRVIRSLRHRIGWTQRELAARARRPRTAVMDLEAGRAGNLRIDTVRAVAAAVGAEAMVDLRYRGADLSRLLDAEHARLQDLWKRHLERCGWTVRVEASFNHFGDRGRVDLLAWHPARGIVLIVELKTVVADIQSLLGALDVKIRVAPQIMKELGLPTPTAVVPMLVIAETSTNRRRLTAHASLFDRYALRGRRATSWLRAPQATAAGTLIFSKLPEVAPGDRRQPGRLRVRRRGTVLRSDPLAPRASAASERL